MCPSLAINVAPITNELLFVLIVRFFSGAKINTLRFARRENSTNHYRVIPSRFGFLTTRHVIAFNPITVMQSRMVYNIGNYTISQHFNFYLALSNNVADIYKELFPIHVQTLLCSSRLIENYCSLFLQVIWKLVFLENTPFFSIFTFFFSTTHRREHRLHLLAEHTPVDADCARSCT